ncbi:hypothetical protein E2C01_093457 [Portunus trituberculatus]|uniref:Uncharacterized protein n=1 Tax=Portunus trituberculatus TaxID=210409 RepID=A0A5B7JU26_PORTR|nr:hypothetical protein [Portunus trituberculatus]
MATACYSKRLCHASGSKGGDASTTQTRINSRPCTTPPATPTPTLSRPLYMLARGSTYRGKMT